MSEELTDKPSRLSGVAVLPWTVALVLFLLLAGLAALSIVGFTPDPFAEPEIPAQTTTEEPAPEVTNESPPAVETEPPGNAETTSPEPPSAMDPAMDPQSEVEPPTDSADPIEAAIASDQDPDSVLPTPSDATTPEIVAPSPVTPETDAPEPEAPAFEASDDEESQGEEGEPAAQSEPDTSVPNPSEVAAVPQTAPSSQSMSAPVPDIESDLPPSPLMIPRGQRGGLRPAPDPGLIESSPLGPLPRIGPDGREPWKVYARPFDDTDTRPRVAVILSGLGLSSAATEAAIQDLPSEVTLAFQPFADNIQQWIQLSRAAGHEVLLNLPMEPVDFPANDPGPRALFVTLSPDENQDRMRWALSRVSGYVGVVNHMGSRFTTSRDSMQPILAELKARGLLFVDARSAARSVATVLASEMEVPRAINDRFLDNREVSRATVDARLAEVEQIARSAGVSIAIGQAFPVTLERIRAWAATLEGKGIALVPISAVVDRQSDR
jgi:uncharacterized protein